MPLRRKNLPDGEQVTPDDVASSVGFAETAMPGMMASQLGRMARLTPSDWADVHELLGKPIQIGRRLLRLSSGDPATNKAILHDATSGDRIVTTLEDFLKAWRTSGQETAEQFPEGAVLSQPGERVTNAQALTGPKGGATPIRRTIPPTATR